MDLVRVRLKNAEVTVSVAHAKTEGLTVLDKPAVNRFGRPLPPKFRRNLKPAASAEEPTPTRKADRPTRTAKKSEEGSA